MTQRPPHVEARGESLRWELSADDSVCSLTLTTTTTTPFYCTYPRNARLSCRGPLGPPLLKQRHPLASDFDHGPPGRRSATGRDYRAPGPSSTTPPAHAPLLTLIQSIYDQDFTVREAKAWKVSTDNVRSCGTGAHADLPLRAHNASPNSTSKSPIPKKNTQNISISIYTLCEYLLLAPNPSKPYPKSFARFRQSRTHGRLYMCAWLSMLKQLSMNCRNGSDDPLEMTECAYTHPSC